MWGDLKDRSAKKDVYVERYDEIRSFDRIARRYGYPKPIYSSMGLVGETTIQIPLHPAINIEKMNRLPPPPPPPTLSLFFLLCVCNHSDYNKSKCATYSSMTCLFIISANKCIELGIYLSLFTYEALLAKLTVLLQCLTYS